MENRDHLAKYSIPQLLRWRVQTTGSKVALREKDFGYWNSYTWNQYYDYVGKIGLGLEKIGIKEGDTIDVIIDGVEERVRLTGIDTPEQARRDTGAAAECFADESAR